MNLTHLSLSPVIHGQYHYLLYSIVVAMVPRMLLTVDENLEPLPVSVRVGQAVDTVGQAGRPKTITGFQTHTTPVLLGNNERAELATDECTGITELGCVCVALDSLLTLLAGLIVIAQIFRCRASSKAWSSCKRTPTPRAR